MKSHNNIIIVIERLIIVKTNPVNTIMYCSICSLNRYKYATLFIIVQCSFRYTSLVIITSLLPHIATAYSIQEQCLVIMIIQSRNTTTSLPPSPVAPTTPPKAGFTCVD
uniref:Uncharacterized protein n=1 Tax=Cacopsylla melanoneura TaxID=428564 RepID=A0A8D8T4W1_9HEMI